MASVDTRRDQQEIAAVVSKVRPLQMSATHKIGIVLASLGLAITILVQFSGDDDDPNRQAVGSKGENAAKPAGNKGEGSKRQRPAGRSPKHAGTAFRDRPLIAVGRLDPKLFEEFVSASQEDPVALLGVLSLMPSDEKLRAALLPLADSNPEVAVGLALSETDPVRVKTLCEILLKTQPDNSLSYLINAKRLFNEGDEQGGAEMLEMARTTGHFESFHKPVLEAQARAWEATDLDTIDRARASEVDPWGEQIQTLLSFTSARDISSHQDDSSAGIADYYRDLNRQLSQDAGSKASISSQLRSLSFEASLELGHLGGDLDDGSKSEILSQSSQRGAHLEKFRREIHEVLNRSDSGLITTYHEKLLNDGELAAGEWLLNRPPN
jgi:hypothetical protein